MSDELARLLEWRGIETACEACGGSGRRVYANTTGWRGGMGGQMITSGVCDRCWGSGDAVRPGADLRKMEAQLADLAYKAQREVGTIREGYDVFQELLAQHEERGAEVDELRRANRGLEKALRSIAEGNLGDRPWQADYDQIRHVAADALQLSRESKEASAPTNG